MGLRLGKYLAAEMQSWIGLMGVMIGEKNFVGNLSNCD